MSPPREIELKLDVPATSLPRLTASSLLKRAAKSAAKPSSLVSTYFDTKNLNLRKKGLSLRVRRVGDRSVQTVKQEDGPATGLFVRREWEQGLKTNQPDLDAARKTALGPLLKKKLRRELEPVFETRVRRQVFKICNGEGEVELSIDKGRIEAGPKTSPLCELELELKHGSAANLFAVAKTLAQEVPVQLAIKSKAQRGYALLTSEKDGPVKATTVALAPEADVQSGFRCICSECLHQLVANQPSVLADDAEGVHQMRVALRRLRSAMSLFSGMLDDPQTAVLKAELKWLTRELGPARELQVFLKRVAQPVASRHAKQPGLMLLSQELRERHEGALARARAAVESLRFRALVLDTAAWIEIGDWRRNPDNAAMRERQLAAFAAEELCRRRKTILKRGKSLDKLDPRRRHRLRIQAKKLRYASEFFHGIFARKKSKQGRKNFVARLEQLQDALGDLNDIAVNDKLSEEIVDGMDAGAKRRDGRAEAFAAGRLSGREEARISGVIKQAKRAYAVFAKAGPFW
jgi:inorganic triphosphatase YgiF